MKTWSESFKSVDGSHSALLYNVWWTQDLVQKQSDIITYFEKQVEGAGCQGDQFEHKKLFILWCHDYLNTGWQNLLLPKIN